MLELGATIRASTRLLARLGVPEILTPSLRPASIELLDTVCSLHKVALRVWAATSINEILRSLVEAIAERLPDAQMPGSFHRVEPGRWGASAVIASEPLQKQAHALVT